MVARRSGGGLDAMTRKLIPRLRRPAVLAWALAALFVLGMGAALWLDELARQAGGYVGYGLVARPGTLPATGAAVVLAALSGAFNPEPLDPPRQAVTSPLAVDVPAGPLGVVYTIGGGVFSVVFGLAIVAGLGRWWCASAVPAGWSASSFAGWRWRRPWSRWRRGVKPASGQPAGGGSTLERPASRIAWRRRRTGPLRRCRSASSWRRSGSGSAGVVDSTSSLVATGTTTRMASRYSPAPASAAATRGGRRSRAATRSSRVGYSLTRRAAVFSPTPATPGSPSEGSPRRIAKST